MFGIFKKKSKTKILYKQYEKLLKDSFELSKVNRKAADQKFVEAQAVLSQIEALSNN